MELRLYCKCGSAMEGEVEPDIAAKRYEAAFWILHSEPGCGATSRADAESADIATGGSAWHWQLGPSSADGE